MDPALACVAKMGRGGAGFTVHFGGSQRSPGWIRFVGSWEAIKKASVVATHPRFPAETWEHTATPPPPGPSDTQILDSKNSKYKGSEWDDQPQTPQASCGYSMAPSAGTPGWIVALLLPLWAVLVKLLSLSGPHQ